MLIYFQKISFEKASDSKGEKYDYEVKDNKLGKANICVQLKQEEE